MPRGPRHPLVEPQHSLQATRPDRDEERRSRPEVRPDIRRTGQRGIAPRNSRDWVRSEEHTSELQSLIRISYAVFCLKNKKIKHVDTLIHNYEKHTNSHHAKIHIS